MVDLPTPEDLEPWLSTLTLPEINLDSVTSIITSVSPSTSPDCKLAVAFTPAKLSSFWIFSFKLLILKIWSLIWFWLKYFWAISSLIPGLLSGDFWNIILPNLIGVGNGITKGYGVITSNINYPEFCDFLDDNEKKISSEKLPEDWESKSISPSDIPLSKRKKKKKKQKKKIEKNEKIEKWLTRWMAGGLTECEEILSNLNSQYKFCFGNQPSIADIFLVPQIFSANRFNIDISKLSNLQKVFENCNQLEAFKNAHPSNQPDSE